MSRKATTGDTLLCIFLVLHLLASSPFGLDRFCLEGEKLLSCLIYFAKNFTIHAQSTIALSEVYL